MNILFVHQNFPGQFKHICRVLAAQGRHQVVFLTKPNDNHIPGIRKVVYTPARPVTGAPLNCISSPWTFTSVRQRTAVCSRSVMAAAGRALAWSAAFSVATTPSTIR